MKLKKGIIIGFTVLLLFTSINSIYEMSGAFPEKSLNKLSRMVKTGNLDNLTLKIYFAGYDFLACAPLSAESVIKMNRYVFTVSGSELEEHIDVLSQLNKDILVPAENKTEVPDVRLYYVFETKGGRRILEFTSWGCGNENVFVNGFEYGCNDAFYDVILPFVPETVYRYRR